MTDKLTDSALDELVRAEDPLRPDTLPSAAETEQALRHLLAAGPATPRPSAVPLAGRRRLLAATTVTVAAVTITLALLLVAGATTSPPAFAVSRNPNGSVTVRQVRVEGIVPADVAGANRKLAAMGVRARIVEGWTAPGVQVKCRTGQPVTLKPWRIPPHQTLIVAADRDGRFGFDRAQIRALVLARVVAEAGRRPSPTNGPITTAHLRGARVVRPFKVRAVPQALVRQSLDAQARALRLACRAPAR